MGDAFFPVVKPFFRSKGTWPSHRLKADTLTYSRHAPRLFLRNSEGQIGQAAPIITFVDAFRMFEFYLAGNMSAVQAVCDWALEREVMGFRVFSMYHPYIGTLIPSEHPDYYVRLREFAFYLHEMGLGLDLTVLADVQGSTDREWVMTRDPRFDAQAHWRNVVKALRDCQNVYLSLGNQWPKNGFDPLAFLRPVTFAGLLSRGSALEDMVPNAPNAVWDVLDFHPSRTQFSAKAKSIKDTRDLGFERTPIYVQEPIGIGEVNEEGRTTNDPVECYRFYGGLAMFGAAMVCAHVRSLIVPFALPGPQADLCVQAMVKAVRDVPRQYAMGNYRRGIRNGNPDLALEHIDRYIEDPLDNTREIERPRGAVRTYELSYMGSGVICACMPGAEWTAQWQAAARMTEAYAFRDEQPTIFSFTR